jgi:hypothetical protein
MVDQEILLLVRPRESMRYLLVWLRSMGSQR